MTTLRRFLSLRLFHLSENVCLVGEALNRHMVTLSCWLDDLARTISPRPGADLVDLGEIGMDPDRRATP